MNALALFAALTLGQCPGGQCARPAYPAPAYRYTVPVAPQVAPLRYYVPVAPQVAPRYYVPTAPRYYAPSVAPRYVRQCGPNGCRYVPVR